MNNKATMSGILPEMLPLVSNAREMEMCDKIQQPICWIRNRLSCTGVSLNHLSSFFSGTDFIDQICSNLNFLGDLLL